jgi:hypothetical protein
MYAEQFIHTTFRWSGLLASSIDCRYTDIILLLSLLRLKETSLYIETSTNDFPT